MYTTTELHAFALTVLQALGFISQETETLATGIDINIPSDQDIARLPCNQVDTASAEKSDAIAPIKSRTKTVIHRNADYGIEYILSKDFGNGVFKPYAHVECSFPSCELCSPTYNIYMFFYDGVNTYQVDISLYGSFDSDDYPIKSIDVSESSYSYMFYKFVVDKRYKQIVPSPEIEGISLELWPVPESED